MKLLVNLFNKYMSADNVVNNSFELKVLNKKRGKSKSRIRRNMSHLIQKKEEEDFHQKNNTEEKNLNIARQNIRHFFHFNWDDDSYEKESTKIGKYITSTLYWVLIDTSYFREENIENDIKKIDDEYLEMGSINNIINDELYKEKKSINKNNNIINNNNIDKISLDNFKNKINSDKSHSIISYLNYDKKGKHFPNVLGYNVAKENMSLIKENIKYYINIVNKINKERIEKLKRKAMDIQSKYNSKNNNKENNLININDDNELEESYLYEKNQESMNIKNKFWNYLYHKEKDLLVKREEKYNQEKDKKGAKSEEKEDNFCVNGCNICNVEDIGQNYYLYECVQCGIKVHPLCYRIKTSPDPKRWKCSKCKSHKYEDAINLECILCPIRGGAMQRAKISKESSFYKTIMKMRRDEEKNEKKNEKKYKEKYEKKNEEKNEENNNSSNQEYPWVHLSCALWNNDVKIDIYDKKKNIKFDEEKILKNYSNLCYVCKKRNYGPTIKCKNPNCNIYCHPECARDNDYYLDMEASDKIWKFSLYCQNHRPNRFIKYLNRIIKGFNKEIFYFSDALKYVYNLYKQNKSKDFYPLKPLTNSENNISLFEDDDDDDESDIILSKKKRNSKFKRNFSKKRRLVSYSRNSSRHSIYIDIKNNYDFKNDKIINNPFNEENNLIKNCVSQIKINNEENDKIPLSGDNNPLIINNSQLNMNLTNETNSIKSNISHNYSNSSENNKSSTKYDSLSPIMLDQKEEFALCLLKYLRNFYMKSRVICLKGNDCYRHLDDKEELDEAMMDQISTFSYNDLKEGKYQVKDMQYKGYDKSNKNYEEIYKDEDEFNSYFEKQIEIYKIKVNSKYNENKSEEINDNIDNNKKRSDKSKKNKY